MSRMVVILLLGASAVAAPVPKAKPGGPWPAQVGTKWEYDQKGKIETHEVTEATEADGTTTAVITITPFAGQKRTQKLEVRKDGVYLIESTGLTIPAPIPLWKPGAKAGDTWVGKYTLTDSRIDVELTFQAGQPEEVTVPAGTFTATPITHTYSTARGNVHVFWYADGVGLVKHLLSDQVTEELKAFTPAKEGKK